MGVTTLEPSLLQDYGVELQAIASSVNSAASGGQGSIASALFLEAASGEAIRADENTVKTNLLGVCTQILNSNGAENPNGYIATNTAAKVYYASAASIVGKRFRMGEDGLVNTIKTLMAANPSWVFGSVYIPLINGTDNVAQTVSFQPNNVFAQLLDSSALTATKGNLFLTVWGQAPANNQIPATSPATDTSACDWEVSIDLT